MDEYIVHKNEKGITLLGGYHTIIDCEDVTIGGTAVVDKISGSTITRIGGNAAVGTISGNTKIGQITDYATVYLIYGCTDIVSVDTINGNSVIGINPTDCNSLAADGGILGNVWVSQIGGNAKITRLISSTVRDIIGNAWIMYALGSEIYFVRASASITRLQHSIIYVFSGAEFTQKHLRTKTYSAIGHIDKSSTIHINFCDETMSPSLNPNLLLFQNECVLVSDSASKTVNILSFSNSGINASFTLKKFSYAQFREAFHTPVSAVDNNSIHYDTMLENLNYSCEITEIKNRTPEFAECLYNFCDEKHMRWESEERVLRFLKATLS